MKYKSVFDIIGPIMVGPSSSHTAGAAKIGLFARQLFGRKPKEITITIYGSFAKTYKGHATDVALLGGLLNFAPCDERIPNAKQLIKDQGITINFIESDIDHVHPNTVKLELTDSDQKLSVVGVSIGGGQKQIIEINDYQFKGSEQKYVIFAVINKFQSEKIINDIENIISKFDINLISSDKSSNEIDKTIGLIFKLRAQKNPRLINEIQNLDGVKQVHFILEDGK